MPGIFYTLNLDAKGMAAGLAAARSAMGSFVGGVAALGTAGLAGGLAVAGLAALGLKKAITEAANMEGMVTSFKVLLGSASAAQARMKELAKFAADTPFELPEVAAASRTLETLTKGALATKAGLTLVGDVASGTQQPFEELAVWVGRLYDGLQSGRQVGEAMMRMQELGIISGDTRAKIEALQQAGQKGDAVWRVAAQALGRFSGMMQEQSQTWNGLMSTLKDNVNAVFREFGAPVLASLKPFLTEAIAMSNGLAVTAKKWGTTMAVAITMVRQAWSDGSLGELAGLSLKIGFATALDYLASAWSKMISFFKTGAGGIFSGLGEIFAGLGLQLSASISEGINSALRSVSIHGVPLISENAHATASAVNRGMSMAGEARVAGGAAQIAADGGIAKQIVGFVAGLATEINEAKGKFGEKWQAAVDAFLADLNKPEQPRKTTLPNASPALAHAELSSSIGDRLSKIGGYIGNGGPRGEKAAQDTALNTGKIYTTSLETNRLLGVVAAKSGGETTF